MDLNHLTLSQLLVGLLLLTAADFVSGVGSAIAHHTFTVDEVAQFISTHVLGRVIPLAFLAAVGLGIPQLGVEGIPAVFAIFLAGGAAYVAETVSSIAQNVGTVTPATVSRNPPTNPNPTDPHAAV